MPKEVDFHDDNSAIEFAHHVRALSEWTRRMNRLFRNMHLCNLLHPEDLPPFREIMPASLREIADAAETAAAAVEKRLDGQINRYGSESCAPALIRQEVHKLRMAIKYLPELNEFLRFADEKEEEKKRKAEKKAAKAAAEKLASKRKLPAAKKTARKRV